MNPTQAQSPEIPGHPWCQRLLTPLAETTPQREPLEEDPRWEQLESDARKLGTLQHGQVNRERLCEQALQLLESRSKELPLLTLLLRALLPASEPATLLLACQLQRLWWQHYAPPGPLTASRSRLLRQSLERISGCWERLAPQIQSTTAEGLAREIEQLRRLIEPAPSEIATHLDRLQELSRLTNRATPTPAPAQAECDDHAGHPVIHTQPRESEIPAQDSPRLWRQTLLSMANQLCQQEPTTPIGYRLRRHAIWSHISTLPLEVAPQHTSLAAPSRERVEYYQASSHQPTMDLWKQIEQSTTLSPYWFDGHALSAQMARQLGFIDVAQAIHQELVQFLHRLPPLQHYRFADGTPFLAEASAHWLAQTSRSLGSLDAPMLEPGHPTELAELEEALRGSCALKQRVQLQLQLAAQLEQRQQLATASLCYHALQQQTQQIQLCDWEPELFATLTQACQRHPMS